MSPPATAASAEKRSQSSPTWADTRDEMAIAQLRSRLPAPAEPCTHEGCRISFSSVAEGKIVRDGRTLEVVLYATVSGDGGGHSTRVSISLAEFEGSRLVRTQLHFADAGTYGRPFEADERYVIVPLNSREYAVVIEDHDMHLGQATDHLSVFIVTAGGVMLGYSKEAGLDNSGTGTRPDTRWHTAWMLIDVPDGRPELFLTRRGLDEGRIVDAIERRRWNGSDFAPVPMAVTETVPGTAGASASAASATGSSTAPR